MEQVSSSLPVTSVELTIVQPVSQQVVNMEEISQYYVFADKSSKIDCIIYDSPKLDIKLDTELPLSGHASSLQTIFLVRASGKPHCLGTKVPVHTYRDLDLLDSLLEDHDDKIVVDFLHFGWPMSRSLFSSHVNQKGALDFPDVINQYLATEQSNNTLLGPFSHNPFPDRTASFPLNSVPK